LSLALALVAGFPLAAAFPFGFVSSSDSSSLSDFGAGLPFWATGFLLAVVCGLPLAGVSSSESSSLSDFGAGLPFCVAGAGFPLVAAGPFLTGAASDSESDSVSALATTLPFAG